MNDPGVVGADALHCHHQVERTAAPLFTPLAVEVLLCTVVDTDHGYFQF